MVEVTYVANTIDFKMIWKRSDKTLWDFTSADFDIDLSTSTVHIRRDSTQVEIPTKTPTSTGAQQLVGELHASGAITDFPSGVADLYGIWSTVKNVGGTKVMTSDEEFFKIREH